MYKYFFFLVVSLLTFSCNPDDGASVDTILLSVQALSVEEGDEPNNQFINVRLSQATSNVVSAFIKTIDNSARAGEDFEGFSDYNVVFQAGETSKDVPIQILGDDILEPNESFYVRIISAENAEIAQYETEIVIVNDDSNVDFVIPTTGYQSPLSYTDKTLIWSDEFNEDGNITDNWTYETGTGFDGGWGNNEQQYYTANNAALTGGYLVIEARNELFGGREYTSARMISANKFDFKFGRVDIRALLPKTQGIWPALWMLGSNFWDVSWPYCGEIDIMELLGHEPNKVYGTVHWDNAGSHAEASGNETLDSGNFDDEFHVFSIEWSTNQISWLLDGNVYHTVNISDSNFDEIRNDFFFIMNIAVGGTWPGNPDNTTIFPQRMIVDYIRVFQ